MKRTERRILVGGRWHSLGITSWSIIQAIQSHKNQLMEDNRRFRSLPRCSMGFRFRRVRHSRRTAIYWSASFATLKMCCTVKSWTYCIVMLEVLDIELMPIERVEQFSFENHCIQLPIHRLLSIFATYPNAIGDHTASHSSPSIPSSESRVIPACPNSANNFAGHLFDTRSLGELP